MDIALLQVLTKAQIKSLLKGVQRAFDEHVRWMCRCQNILLSCGEVDVALLDIEAHRNCNFGRWYYSSIPNQLRISPDFLALGELHRRFHDAARMAMEERSKGRELTSEMCEQLLSAQADLLMALNRYLREVAEGDQLFDPLTGLMNRQEMYRLLNNEKSRSERNGSLTTIAMADLDHFKSVNDRFGHEAGDCVLREAAARFSLGLRIYDLLFRMGGEEFLFCFPDTDQAEAAAICERIRENIENTIVEAGGGRSVSVTVSFGIAPLMTDKDVSDSLRMADEALYSAKAAGRNRVLLWSPRAAGMGA